MFCFLPVIGGAVTQTWEQLFITRLLLGIGMGSKASTVPIFAAENSPALIRGSLVMCKQYIYIASIINTDLDSKLGNFGLLLVFS